MKATVRQAGKKFLYRVVTGTDEYTRRSTKGDYTHVVLVKAKDSTAPADEDWWVYSFHSRYDLAEKQAQSAQVPQGLWTAHDAKILNIEGGE